jgi:hypothetical protein
MVQAEIPEQTPPHPRKDAFASGAADRVTKVPEGKLARQAGPHAIPGGFDSTIPGPLAAAVSVGWFAGRRPKIAETECA